MKKELSACLSDFLVEDPSHNFVMVIKKPLAKEN